MALTEVAGSSDYFIGGVVVYADSAKQTVLDIPAGVLEQYGAVSPQTAALMAEQTRTLFGTRLGIAITGIAGPGGGTEEKPVGTVWFGVAGPQGSRTETVRFSGSRTAVREQAVRHALAMIQDCFEN